LICDAPPAYADVPIGEQVSDPARLSSSIMLRYNNKQLRRMLLDCGPARASKCGDRPARAARRPMRRWEYSVAHPIIDLLDYLSQSAALHRRKSCGLPDGDFSFPRSAIIITGLLQNPSLCHSSAKPTAQWFSSDLPPLALYGPPEPRQSRFRVKPFQIGSLGRDGEGRYGKHTVPGKCYERWH